MTTGIFYSQINEVECILKALGLWQRTVNYPQVPENPASTFRGLNYLNAWDLSYKKDYYKFQIVDNSLLVFSAETKNPLKLSYSFLECPYEKTLSYPDFLKEFDYDYEECGNELWDEFLLYSETDRQFKESVCPIRYDYDTTSYTPGRHPASHLHIGCNNSIRVGTKKILRPISFIYLIVRQIYPAHWQQYIKDNEHSVIEKNVRSTLSSLEDEYWSFADDCEMSLV